MNEKEVEFNSDGFVHRKFTREWASSGIINISRLSDMVASVITSRNEMVEYIEALHNKIDWILEKNNCCDVCFTANCESDHK